MLRRRAESSFPVWLWGSLLLALLLLTQPAAVRRIEALGGRVVTLPLRAISVLAPREVRGAADDTARRAVASLAVADLSARVERVVSLRPSGVSTALLASPVGVIERRASAPGAVDELVLDARRSDLGSALTYATVGDVLIGFLAAEGVTDDPQLAGLARVELLWHAKRGRLPRRVPARIEFDDGARLAFLVEPASSIDRWPLRCALLDDPYRAARLGVGAFTVRTSGLRDDPLGPLPEGLEIGALRVFGYRDARGRVLPIGFEVEPALAADSIDVITLWRTDPTAPDPTPAARATAIPVRLMRLPVPAAGRARYLATPQGTTVALRAGAAVLEGSRLVGICEEADRGYAIVAAFGQPGRDWSLVFVPDGEDSAPRWFVARAIGRDDARVRLQARTPWPTPARGRLHAGGASRDFPSGLWLGVASIDANGIVTVEHERLEASSGLTIYLHRAVLGGGP